MAKIYTSNITLKTNKELSPRDSLGLVTMTKISASLNKEK